MAIRGVNGHRPFALFGGSGFVRRVHFKGCSLVFLAAVALGQESIELAPLAVEGSRRTMDARGVDPLGRAWDPRKGAHPGQLIDAWLAEAPTFSLFRRDSALSAHPTTQGVSLRTLGPTAASRSLVLKDGVPQNDPFGGWVPWTVYLPDSLSSIELLPTAQATAWGPLSAGGVILMETGDHPRETGATVSISGRAGGGGDVQVVSRERLGGWSAMGAARWFESDGDWLVHPADRGPLDRRGDLRVAAGELRLSWRGANGAHGIAAGFRAFGEERGNGSPLARNETGGWEASVRADGIGPVGKWELLAYAQHRDFANRFTVFDDNREAETVVLDQFSIPSAAQGASLLWQPGQGTGEDPWSGWVGADFRRLEGTTHEDFSFGLDDRRKAGGTQRFAGAFGVLQRRLWAGSRLEAVARLDHWAISDGFLEERSLPSGAVTRVAAFPDRSAWEPTGSLSWIVGADAKWTGRLSVAHNFRLPTVNELYRPYRVGVDVFGANPGLAPERFTTVEAGVRGQLSPGLSLAGGAYHTSVHDAVANLRIFPGPGPSDAGFVPAGGSYHRRENVERSTVAGVEARLRWAFFDHWRVTLGGLRQETTFEATAIQPELAGQRFPFAPRWRWSVGLERSAERWGGTLRWSGDSGQYDDALNQRALPAFDRWDLSLWHALGRQWSLHLRVENLLDARILTGRASDGERSIAPGRGLWLGLRWEGPSVTRAGSIRAGADRLR